MDTRIKAADLLLDKGVRFRVPAPFYRRWLRKDTLDIKPLRAGTIIEISKVVVANELDKHLEQRAWEQLQNNIEAVALCISIAVLNDKQKIARQADKLAAKLLWRYNTGVLISMFRVILTQTHKEDFIGITKFLVRQAMMMNLGQKAIGS